MKALAFGAALLLGGCAVPAATVAGWAAAGAATAGLLNADVAVVKAYCGIRDCGLVPAPAPAAGKP